MSRERQCCSYREHPYTKFSMLPYAKRVPHEEGVPMRLLFNVASALAAFVAAWLWWPASQPPPRPEVRWQHRPRLRGWARSSAQANRRAALSTGVAALPQGVASVLTARTRKRRRVRETSRDISRSPEAHMCCSFSSSYVRAHSLHSTFESPIRNG